MSEDERLARAKASLEGLAVGDGFGQRFFIDPVLAGQKVRARTLPPAPWRWTDDTQMAISIVEILERYGEINQDALANSFADHYDITRGYGPAMHGLLGNLQFRVPWHVATRWLFNGQGSFGNGAAMRVAPSGAYFADDMEAVVAQAERSAVVTHAHPAAAAGAIAVAVATAYAWRLREATELPRLGEFLELVLPHVPAGEVHNKIIEARQLSDEVSVAEAGLALGTGNGVSAQDTVPFTLWCAGQTLNNFEQAMWLTVSGLGDRDTTCAIVGGIVAAHVGTDGIPADWLVAREPLPGLDEWLVANDPQTDTPQVDA